MFDRNLSFNDLRGLPFPKSIIDADVFVKWGIELINLSELNKNLQQLPNPCRLMNTIGLRETITPTAIESIFTTAAELYWAIHAQLHVEYSRPYIKGPLNGEARWRSIN